MKRERHQLCIERVSMRPIYIPISKVAGLVASRHILSASEEAAERRRRERVTWSPRPSAGYIVMQMDS